MAEEPTEYTFVVASDCLVAGVPFLRGEEKTVSKEVYRQLLGAGRVCLDEQVAAAFKAQRAADAQAEKAKGKG